MLSAQAEEEKLFQNCKNHESLAQQIFPPFTVHFSNT